MKKTALNFIYQSMFQLLNIILPIITVPIISRALGPQGIGVWNFTNSIVGYFVLFGGLGLANYGVRTIAVARGDKEKLSNTFWELQTFNICISAIVFVAFLIFAFFSDNIVIYLIQSLIVFSVILDISWFFQGVEDFKQIVIRNILIKICGFIAIFVFIHNHNDLWKYVLIQSLTIFASQASLWLFVFKYVDFVKVEIKKAFLHFKPAMSYFVAKVGQVIYLSMNKTILGMMTSMAVVGFYSQSLQMATIVGGFVAALNTVLIPKMSKTLIDKTEDRLIASVSKAMHFQLFLTIAAAFGIIATNDKLIHWFFGAKFASITAWVPVLAPYVVFQGIQSGIAAMYLIPKNDMRNYNVTIFYGAIFSLVINVTLIPVIGIYAAIIATVGSQLLICIARIFVMYRDTEFRFDYLMIFKYIIAGFLMWGAIWSVTKNMHSNIVTTAIQGVVGMIIYMLLTGILKVNPLVEIFLGRTRK
jgi:O-antigen/teichoic acid export membrane protein